MRALADDLRCLAADIQEQQPLHSLTRVMHYTKWIFAALDELEKELADAV